MPPGGATVDRFHGRIVQAFVNSVRYYTPSKGDHGGGMGDPRLLPRHFGLEIMSHQRKLLVLAPSLFPQRIIRLIA